MQIGKSGKSAPRKPARNYAAALLSASTMPSTSLLDEELVLALAHHADHRLGAGGADDQPPLPVEPLHRVLDRGLHLGVLERLAVAIAHVLHHLRQRIEAVAHFRHRLAVLLHHREHLQRRDEAVPGGRIVRHDDVAGRLAAEIEAALAHVLEHVAVADRRARQRRGRAPSGGARTRDWTSRSRPRSAWRAGDPPSSSPPPRRAAGRRRPRGPSRPRSRRGRRRRRARCRCRRASRAPCGRAPRARSSRTPC